MMFQSDVIIVGSGAAGLFCALNLPNHLSITLITKDTLENSNSYLAQGGICVLRDESDYDAFYQDTLKAGHFENDSESVKIMIHNSSSIISDLVSYGTQFEKENDAYIYTKEGGHSSSRILFHKDETGKEIMTTLIKQISRRDNLKIHEHVKMTDLIIENNKCVGIHAHDLYHKKDLILKASKIVLASGGIGGLYEHSTNFKHITGDAISIAKKHQIKLKHLDYVQIHPTTLYTKQKGRRFLISESVRGEGAFLLDKNGQRFADELLPRDVLTQQIYQQMEKDQTDYVYLSLIPIGKDKILHHFPNIYKRCLEEGYDVTQVSIPVIPAQHYFMGGIEVDTESQTSMKNLYAIGETACNGVHGANRLASNSLLESLVFAKRAAKHIETQLKKEGF